MDGFNLQAFRARFPEAARAATGRTYDFRKLERNFAYLRKDSSWLSAGHVMPLFDPAHTPYADAWPRPDAKQLDRVLKQERVRLAPMEGSETDRIQGLMRALHNLGIVSLILRLCYPEKFAVFSAPVASLLLVQRARAADLYLAYCRELAEWRDHFRMGGVAETEMALWAFCQLAINRNEDSDGAQLEFDSDVWIQRRRIGQVLRPFIRRYGPLELARLLAEENPKLAGMIAGEEHERLLRLAAARFYPNLSVRTQGWADTLISLLIQDGRVSLEEKTILRRIWSARNQAVHPDEPLDLAQVENMIDGIERFGPRWSGGEKPEG